MSRRTQDPAAWLRQTTRRVKNATPKGRRFGLVDLVVVVLVVLAVWTRTPVGALGDQALAAITGAPAPPWSQLIARFDTGETVEEALIQLAQAEPLDAPPLDPGDLPEPWRSAARLTLADGLPEHAQQQVAALRLQQPDATVMDVLDALHDDDPEQTLARLIVPDAQRQVAIERARAAGAPQPTHWSAWRAYLPRASRMQGDRYVGRTLALATALDLTWPVDDRVRISSPFGHRVHPVLGTRRFHNGVDLPVPIGTSIVAAQAGTVRTGEDNTSGRYVVIDHGNGVRTSYCHLSEVIVEGKTQVQAGQVIARSGNTGRSTGPHLHFTLRLGRKAIDPAPLRRKRDRPGS